MSTLKVNTVVDSSGGNTATVNGVTPSTHTVKGRNLIINGAMEIAQRASTYASAVSQGYHAVDRMRVMGNSSVGQWTISQDSDVPAGFIKSLKYECTTADTSLGSTDHLGLGYFPEGHHMNPVSKGTSGAKSMTLSFYLKANVTKTLVVELVDAGNARHVNFAVTPSATNTWERITLSIPADTSGSFNQGTNSKAAELNFWLASGTNYTTGSLQSTWTSRTAANIMAGVSNWADTVGNTIWITGLQLELGDVATEFDHRSFDEEWNACQRYCTVYNVGAGNTHPQNLVSPNHPVPGAPGHNDVSNRPEWFMSYPVKRATPTITVSNPTYMRWLASSNVVIDGNGSVTFPVGTGIQNANCFQGVASSIATSNVPLAWVHNNGGTYPKITIDSEL